ncbi:alpha/beta fold hydrolase [Allokutzneria albata]|uniref:Alpha/beta hydrolase fold n=1 Tax=Allokutzneria albata TaxID=211114 RepID=A0A1G9V6J3_ALLAB|nr:alpha/beta fold hydrolase [Allokutzneria albata]SDM67769.1 alpha/beta hydrolase fold [Allokutzneria albata]
MTRTKLIAAALGVAVVAVTMTATQQLGAAERTPWSTVDWKPCDRDPTMQCAHFVVPADWRRTAGPTLPIEVVKVPARKPQQRVGSLIFNIGSGHNTSLLFEKDIPEAAPVRSMLEQLTERVDVVVFDQRGLGRPGTPTFSSCPERPAPTSGLILAPDEAGWRAHAERNAAYDASCREALGASYLGMNSWQIAHDVDALRAALGEEKLRYAGNSYGTVYPQAYAELFPDRVDRMYLDGVADHTQPVFEDWLRNYAVAMERQFDRFRDWCVQRKGCPLHGQDVAQVWDDLVAKASKSPLPANGGKTVSLPQLQAGLIHGMTPPLWPALADGMAKARRGDASFFLPPPPSGTGPWGVMSALLCHDFMPKQPTYQEFLAIEQRLKAVAPRMGWLEGRYEMGRCLGIPGDPAATYPPHRLQAKGVPPVLVGIGELDQNTNNLGAANVAGQFPGARALWHGDGHAAYIAGNKCLREHVNRYLFGGPLPADGLRCPADLVTKIPDRPTG